MNNTKKIGASVQSKGMFHRFQKFKNEKKEKQQKHLHILKFLILGGGSSVKY